MHAPMGGAPHCLQLTQYSSVSLSHEQHRYFKLFPLLGIDSAGIKKYCHFVCAQIAEHAQANLKKALQLANQGAFFWLSREQLGGLGTLFCFSHNSVPSKSSFASDVCFPHADLVSWEAVI